MASEYFEYLADGVYKEEGLHCPPTLMLLFGAGSVPRAGHGGLKWIYLPKEPSFLVRLYISLAKSMIILHMFIRRFIMRSLVLVGFKADLLPFPYGSEF